MPEAVADRKNPLFKIYHCRTPQVRNAADVPHATEQQLIDDLHDMDADGWEIAHGFPTGTCFLMKRKDSWVPPPDEKADGKTGK